MLARRPRRAQSQSDVSIRRTLFVAAFVVFWMLGIGARLVYLQVSEHEKLVARAQQQQQEAVATTPQRGPVLDRQGRELARSIDTLSVFIAPEEFDQKTPEQTTVEIECTSSALATVLGLEPRELFTRISEARKSGSRFIDRKSVV